MEVSCFLKDLVDGEVVLADGRRLLSEKRAKRVKMKDLESTANKSIAIHPNFFLVVLANHPGFPFLGNDFFQEVGDVFSTHVIENLDRKSEIQLLKAYGPSVSDDIINKLANSFSDLRDLQKNGLINYPFSARECVSIIKHIENFPRDGVSTAIDNVLAFDSLVPSIRMLISEVFHENGLSINAVFNRYSSKELTSRKTIKIRRSQLNDSEIAESIPKTGLSEPKHGKVDPHNKPHVGGNQWRGGSGGSDTAGQCNHHFLYLFICTSIFKY